jgi:hypothetical protein
LVGLCKIDQSFFIGPLNRQPYGFIRKYPNDYYKDCSQFMKYSMTKFFVCIYKVTLTYWLLLTSKFDWNFLFDHWIDILWFIRKCPNDYYKVCSQFMKYSMTKFFVCLFKVTLTSLTIIDFEIWLKIFIWPLNRQPMVH